MLSFQHNICKGIHLFLSIYLSSIISTYLTLLVKEWLCQVFTWFSASIILNSDRGRDLGYTSQPQAESNPGSIKAWYYKLLQVLPSAQD